MKNKEKFIIDKLFHAQNMMRHYMVKTLDGYVPFHELVRCENLVLENDKKLCLMNKVHSK